MESLEGGAAPTIEGLAGKDTWLFSPAGRYLVSAQGPADRQAKNVPVTLRVHDGNKGYAVVASRKDKTFGTWLTISADGRRLAVVDRGTDAPGWIRIMLKRDSVRFTILSLPELESISTCTIARPGGIHLHSLALSPDGKLLAATDNLRSSPYVVDTTTGQPLNVNPGHSHHIYSAHFSADGKSIRSLDADNQVCLWERATLRLLHRKNLPDAINVLSIREPDGKYLISQEIPEGRKTLQVRDTDTGQVIATTTLPQCANFDNSSFFWIGDNEVLCLVRNQLYRFDYRKRAIVGKPLRIEEMPGGKAKAGRGRQVDLLGSDLGTGHFATKSLNLVTGKVQTHGRGQLGSSFFMASGVVPGGKLFYLYDVDLHLFDRRTTAR